MTRHSGTHAVAPVLRNRALAAVVATFVLLAGIIVQTATAPPARASASCTWAPLTTGTSDDFFDVSRLDLNRGWAVGLGPTTGNSTEFDTSDGGATWQNHSLGQNGQLFGVEFADQLHGFVTGPRNVRHSVDGGQTWSVSSPTAGNDPNLSWTWNEVDTIDGTTAWVAGSAGSTVGAVIKTSDGGATWTEQLTGVPGLFDIQFVDASHGWAAGFGGTIVATSDGGATWATQTSGTGQTLTGVGFGDGSHGWVAGTNGTILATANGGASWVPQASGTTEDLQDVDAVGAGDAVAVGNGGSIVATSNGGGTWTTERQPGGTLSAVDMLDTTRAWAVGYGGVVLSRQCSTPTVPTITATPNSGLAASGQTVTVAGTGFTPGAAINLAQCTHTGHNQCATNTVQPTADGSGAFSVQISVDDTAGGTMTTCGSTCYIRAVDMITSLMAQAPISFTGPAPVSDDFNGTTLDPLWNTQDRRWCAGAATPVWVAPATEPCVGAKQNPPYGSQTVSGGELHMSGGATRAFPYIWSSDGAVPTQGDVVVEARIKYDALKNYGSGLHLRQWTDASPVGSNKPFDLGQCASAAIWGDQAAGTTVRLANGTRVIVPGGGTNYHTYRFEYASGKEFVFVDGALLVGPIATTQRIDRMWFGNPSFLDPPHYPLADWSDFRVDYVHVSSPTGVDSDNNGVYDGTQAWTPKNVPPSSQIDSDGDGLPDSCDPSNDAPGTIVLHQQTDPAGDPTGFGYTSAMTATLHDDERTQRSVAAGTYSVSQTPADGWAMGSIECDDSDSVGDLRTGTVTFKVAAGESVECTVLNVKSHGDEFNDDNLDGSWNTSTTRWCSASSPNAWFRPADQRCRGLGQATPFGSMTTSGGALKMSAGANTLAFPYISSSDGLFPSSGDFVMDVRMKYDELAPHGDGLHVLRWPDPTPLGTNSPYASKPDTCAGFGIWAGSASGLRVNLAGNGVTLGAPTAWHTYRLEYVSGKYLVFLDGATTPLIGALTTTLRPDRMWIGNPVFTDWAAANWTDFSIDYARVSQPGFIDSDGNEVDDGSQTWAPQHLSPASQVDTDNDGIPDSCDPTTTPASPGTITLVKATDPDGSPVKFDFSGALHGTIGDGEQLTADVVPGSYTVTEASRSGWRMSEVACDDDDSTYSLVDGTVRFDVASNEDVTCVVTNHQDRGTLVLEKQTEPDGSTVAFPFTGAATGSLADGQQLTVTLLAGVHDVTETAVPGWRVLSISCDDGDSTTNVANRTASVAISDGETVHCTFTNRQLAKLVVEKVTNPSTATDQFNFEGDVSGPVSNGGVLTAEVDPGIYAATEVAKAGWDVHSIVCNDSDSTGDPATGRITFVAGPGEEVRCTVTNQQRAVIEVQKVSDPAGGTGFTFEGALQGSLDDGQVLRREVLAGAYDVTETSKDYWALKDLTCDDNDSTGDVATHTAHFLASPGETVRCVFANKGIPDLEISKAAPPTARLGEPFDYRLRVDNIGTGPASAVSITDVVPGELRVTPHPGCTLAQPSADAATTVTCDLGDLAPGASAEILLNVVPVFGCSIVGTQGPDTLVGTEGPDVICGAGDEDTISGLGGYDVLWGDGPAAALAALIVNRASVATPTPEWTLDNNDSGPVPTQMVDGLDRADDIFGGDGDDELHGQRGNDYLNGGSGNDHVLGELGNDQMSGGAGDDTLEGGSGNDTGFGDTGNDVVLGGADDDVLNGGFDNDRIEGGDGNDNLTGDLGNDTLLGDAGNDTLSGNEGDDSLAGGIGDDALYGGADNDLLHGDAGNDSLSGYSGTDKLFGDDGADTLHGDDGADELHGGNGDDFAYGDSGNDVVNGDDGNDQAHGNIGDDTVYGDAGGDFVTGDDGNDAVSGGLDDDTVSGDAGNDVVHGDDGRDAVHGGDDVDSVYGDAGNDLVTGDAGDDTLVSGGADTDSVYGGLGNDLVHGDDGNDDVHGESGNDSVYGDAGNDQVTGDDGNDVVSGGLHDDTTSGGNGDDVVHGDDGNDLVHGEAGKDSVYGDNGLDSVFGDDGDDPVVSGGSDADTVSGGNGNDFVSGDAGRDRVLGDAGADFLYGDAFRSLTGVDDGSSGPGSEDVMLGGTGDDTMFGQSSNDEIHGDVGADTIYGQAGNDQLDGGGNGDTLNGGAGNDTIYGDVFQTATADDGGTSGTGFEDTINGGTGDDSLYGQSSVDVIDGGAGNDTINGNAGADTVHGDDGADTVHGGIGNDSVLGDAGDDPLVTGDDGADVVRGGDGNDLVRGENGNDTLYGDAGNDAVDGGDGDDHMLGGLGSDYLTGDDGDDELAGDNSTDYGDAVGSPDSLNGGNGDDLLLGQGGNDGCSDAVCSGTNSFSFGPGLTSTAPGELEGGRGVDRIHGGAGNDRLDGGAVEVNNVLFGAAGIDYCSNGPLSDSRYTGTDRGDIRDRSCELPAIGQSRKWTQASNGTYTSAPYTINEANTFKW